MQELYELLLQKKNELDNTRGLPIITSEMSADDRSKAERDRKLIEQTEDLLYRMFTGKDNSGIRLSFKEAIMTRDFPQLLQRVVNDRILMPVEPEYIGQTILSTTIPVNREVGNYSMPSFGYLRAGEVAEGQEYPAQTAEINRNATSIAIRKHGIRVEISGEAMAADEIGLWGMHVEAARMAMNRHKEEEIFSLFKNITQPCFDNELAFTDITTALRGATLTADSDVATWGTTGKDIDGNLNGTVTIFDFIDAMASLMARGYDPSDMLINPLAWTILARDPVLNGFYLNGRAMPAQVTGAPQYKVKGPEDLGSVALPWNMTVHVTKFTRVRTEVGDDALASGVPYLTDIYIGSRRNGVLLLQGSPLQQDAYTDFKREMYSVRLREYFGTGLADGGRSWTAIKNVRIDRAYDPVLTRSQIV